MNYSRQWWTRQSCNSWHVSFVPLFYLRFLGGKNRWAGWIACWKQCLQGTYCLWCHLSPAITQCNQYLFQNEKLKQEIFLLPVWKSLKVFDVVNCFHFVCNFFMLQSWPGPPFKTWEKLEQQGKKDSSRYH